MSAYKYANPLEWFNQHIAGLDYEELLSTAREVASKLDGDALQDIFQDDMEKDGYFVDLETPVCSECGASVDLQEGPTCADCRTEFVCSACAVSEAEGAESAECEECELCVNCCPHKIE